MLLTHEPITQALLLDSISDGLIAVDERGRVAFLNRAAEQLTLWPRDEALGRPYGEVLGVNGNDDACPLGETCRSGKGTESVTKRSLTDAR